MIIGIDTSNYTTSVCAIDEGKIYNIRKILSVREGNRGLRQSDALFQHVKLLPELFKTLSDKINIKNAQAIGVSTTPRFVEGSYMPVFLSGEGYASVISSTLNIPLYKFSHQEGHIMAGVYSAHCEELLDREFLSVHISGGTTEILKTKYINKRFKSEIIGGTLDISCGQLIDRIGVKLGLPFPCGKQLEVLAQDSNKFIPLPISVKDSNINFSGTETKLYSLINKYEKSDIANSVLMVTAKSLVKSINNAILKYQINDVLIAGGVASNKLIREYITDNIQGNIFFASHDLCTDNAVGISILTQMSHFNTLI